jgi:hypothetical protein
MVKNFKGVPENLIPPQDLVELWVDLLASRSDEAVFSLAAQWGADAELEKCCEVLDNLNDGYWSEKLRAARRPKPTLKMQALEVLEDAKLDSAHYNILLRALDALRE